MGAVAVNETVTWHQPQLFFVWQSNGKTFDVTNLTRSVWQVNVDGSYTQQIADAPLDMSNAPTGTRIDVGIYHADFTATDWTPGTYEIRWTYTPPTDPDALNGGADPDTGADESNVPISTPYTATAKQRFEVVDPNYFPTGNSYVGYADSVTLKQYAPFSTMQIGQLQALIDKSSRRIEDLTGRFFGTRYMKYRVDGKATPGLMLQEPIIGISLLEIESGATGLTMTLTKISLDGVRVRNRHLQGIFDPDDRDDPGIDITRFEGILFQTLSTFPKGPRTIHVTGVFGYTNPDGGPFGVVPPDLTEVVGNFATKFQQDPFGLNLSIWEPSVISKASTRDQSISYFKIGSFLTGDPTVDRVLIKYFRPAHLAAV